MSRQHMKYQASLLTLSTQKEGIDFLGKSYNVYLCPQVLLFICRSSFFPFPSLNPGATHPFPRSPLGNINTFAPSLIVLLDPVLVVGLKRHQIAAFAMLLLHFSDFMLKVSSCLQLSSLTVHCDPLDASVLITLQFTFSTFGINSLKSIGAVFYFDFE